MTAYCNSPRCGAPIEWVITKPAGRTMPIDVNPVPNGNLVKTGMTAPNGSPVVRYLKKAELDGWPDDEPRYVSHFATCPDHAEFRNRKE